MPLSQKQVSDICLRYTGDSSTCRYLMIDSSDGRAYCTKLRPDTKRKRDLMLDVFVKDCRKKGSDPYSSNVALGDNCPGYLILKTVEQGYDQKN